MKVAKMDLKNWSNRTDDVHDLYSSLTIPNAARRACLILAVAAVGFGLPFFFSVIWFEKNGSDKKRTILNMLVSKVNWTMINYLLFVQVPEIVRYIYGPLPDFICYSQHLVRYVLVWSLILLFDSITTMQYLLIFWLKNPGAFNDDFWCSFITSIIHLVAILFCFTWHYMLMGHAAFGLLVCMGKNSTRDLLQQPSSSWSGLLEILSILYNVVVKIRISVYKATPRNRNVKRSVTFKSMFLLEVEQSSLSSLPIICVGLLFVIAQAVNASSLKKIDVKDFNVYPNYLYLYYRSLIGPSLSVFVLSSWYLFKKAYRHAILSELQSIFS